METIIVNYWAVLVAAIAQMIIGALWYSPALFGKQWMSMMNLTEESMKSKKKEAQRGYVLMFVSAVVMCYVLANFVVYAKATTMLDGMLTGFWLWLGFIATVTLGGFLWEGKPFKLYLLNVTYWLVTLVVTSAILVVWV